MIETHALNVGLTPSFRSGWLYHALSMSNGYVAVAFAFCAGAGFWYAAAKEEGFFRLLKRWLFILAVAYWLNASLLPFSYFRGLHGPELYQLFQCDILHVIALSSFLALGLTVLVPRSRIQPVLFLLLSLIAFSATPWIWSLQLFQSLPSFLSLMVSPIPPSKFPLFPWIGYFFAGVALAGFLTESKRPKILATLLGAAAFVTPWFCFWIKDKDFTFPGMPGPFADWYPSPGHSLYRLSGVVALFCLFFLLNEVLKRQNAFVRFLELYGRESLFVYVGHLVLLYGNSLTPGLIRFAANRLNAWETIGVFLVVSLLSFAGAAAWHTCKQKFPRPSSAALAAVVLLSFVFFLVAPVRWWLP